MSNIQAWQASNAGHGVSRPTGWGPAKAGRMMTATKKILRVIVDQNGYTHGGWTPIGGRPGAYGSDLRVGQQCRVNDYCDESDYDYTYSGLAMISKIYTTIHTMSGGGSNYVYVDLQTAE